MSGWLDAYDLAWAIGLITGAITYNVPWWVNLLIGAGSTFVLRVALALVAA